jgi:hypothetical protein
MQRSVWPFIVATLLATPAAAQVRTTPAPATPAPVPRGFVNINGGYQVSSNDFGDTSTFRLNAEDGRLDTDYTVQSGPTIDVAGGATVWRQTPPPGSGAGAAGWQIAAGVGVTRFSRSTPLAIDASVPHPFFFNRQRSVAGEIGGLERSELAVHVQGRAVVPMRGPVQVMIFGGPSFFRVDQDLVSEVSYADEYPYDTAGLGQTVSTRARERIDDRIQRRCRRGVLRLAAARCGRHDSGRRCDGAPPGSRRRHRGREGRGAPGRRRTARALLRSGWSRRSG